MTAVEAVMAGRPVILNPAVPAVDFIGDACLVAETNDVASHAEQVRRLALDPALYARLQIACASCVEPFFDREQGLTAGLREMVKRLGLS